MRTVWLVLLAFMSPIAYGADLYRSVAEDGTISYSDRPLTNDAEVMSITVLSSRASTAAPEKSEQETDSTGTQVRSDADEPSLEELREQKVQNCVDSQSQLALLMRKDQLYRSLPDGSVESLDATEITEVRARAEADVEAWCN